MSNLVIVESPAKAKTIKKYLGPGYEVMASMGHIRDLPKSKLSIDIENNFEPKYVDSPDKKEIIKKLKEEAKKSEQVFLATDPDREGEAISWHLANVLKLPNNFGNRVTFSEITKSGVSYGMSNPRKIDVGLVEAQQTRRILDRLVGYDISQILWRKVRKGLSAGRVQSVAVRILCDRENEIKAFKSEEYWIITAKLKAKVGSAFNATLKEKIHNKKENDDVLNEIDGAEYFVSDVKESKRQKSPAPPFTTSTLQQEASRKLNFQSKRTMSIAQQLYEGVDVAGHGTLGLITYMRTDSLRVSEEAMDAAEKFISNVYGKQYLPQKRRYFKSKANAQDAHEAIRPSTPSITPSEAKESLTIEQYKLYKLIWERFIASQMAVSLQDVVNAEVTAGNHTFKAQGYHTTFDGYTVLYEEGKDEKEEKETSLPKLSVGEKLTLKEISGEQKYTQPPSRFTEATLIKAMEENGVGRPSTYAPTISTILARGYVEREQKSLKPTNLGETVVDFMKQQFSDIVDIKFTAQMEDRLDDIEAQKAERVEVLNKFYKNFSKSLVDATESKRMKVPDEQTDQICEKCGKPMVIKSGRFGKFLACSGFPECRNTKAIIEEVSGNCPICSGKIIARKSKKGKTFYGCENYPKCNFATWDKPIKDLCPKCGSTLFKPNIRWGKPHCLKEGCGYEKK